MNTLHAPIGFIDVACPTCKAPNRIFVFHQWAGHETTRIFCNSKSCNGHFLVERSGKSHLTYTVKQATNFINRGARKLATPCTTIPQVVGAFNRYSWGNPSAWLVWLSPDGKDHSLLVHAIDLEKKFGQQRSIERQLRDGGADLPTDHKELMLLFYQWETSIKMSCVG